MLPWPVSRAACFDATICSHRGYVGNRMRSRGRLARRIKTCAKTNQRWPSPLRKNGARTSRPPACRKIPCARSAAPRVSAADPPTSVCWSQPTLPITRIRKFLPRADVGRGANTYKRGVRCPLLLPGCQLPRTEGGGSSIFQRPSPVAIEHAGRRFFLHHLPVRWRATV